MQVLISNNQVNVLKDSINIDDRIAERTVASFSARTEFNQHFQKGTPVIIKNDNDDIVFSGVIENSTEYKISHEDLQHEIQCIDYHYMADKRRIAKAYQNTLAGDIVRDIITVKLAEEGITAGIIEDGIIIKEAVFNYSRCSDALEAIAEKTGFWWMIDYQKQLHFVSKATNNAPFTVSNIDIYADSLQVERSNPGYINKAFIRGSKDITDIQTETRHGDGVTQSFVVGFPIAKVPTIILNGVQQTLGIKGLDENKSWYWSKGDNTITQDQSGTILTSTDTLIITYQGEFDIVVLSYDKAEIERMKNIEGIGTGIVEEVFDEPDTTNKESAFQSASQKLKKYANIGKRVTFRTWKSGLKSGQLLTCTFLEHGLNNAELLIDAITVNFIDNNFEYTISAVQGASNTSWSKMFYHMATRGQTFVIRENISEQEILVSLEQFNKTWQSIESPNIFYEVYASDTLFPSNSLFPMFKFENRVKYLSFFNNVNQEIFRKGITKEEGTTTDLITSTTYIAPFEANLIISYVGWFGGQQATDTIGTGILIDKQAFNKVKLEIEALQIDKYDTRNFTPMTGILALTADYFQNIDNDVQQLLINSQ